MSSATGGDRYRGVMPRTLCITVDAAVNGSSNPDDTALSVGMLLDRQTPREWAFPRPATLEARLGHLNPREIAVLSEDDVVAACSDRPVIHRYPAAMGRRIHALDTMLTADDAQVHRRLRGVPRATR